MVFDQPRICLEDEELLEHRKMSAINVQTMSVGLAHLAILTAVITSVELANESTARSVRRRDVVFVKIKSSVRAGA